MIGATGMLGGSYQYITNAEAKQIAKRELADKQLDAKFKHQD